jgi:hypothetical protein
MANFIFIFRKNTVVIARVRAMEKNINKFSTISY